MDAIISVLLLSILTTFISFVQSHPLTFAALITISITMAIYFYFLKKMGKATGGYVSWYVPDSIDKSINRHNLEMHEKELKRLKKRDSSININEEINLYYKELDRARRGFN